MEGLARVAFGLFGLAVLIGIAFLFSNNKRAVDWRLVATGVALQIAFAALVLLVPGGKDAFEAIGHGFVRVLGFVNEGSNFVFGGLMDVDSLGFIFAFQVLPTIIFFASLMGVLYHLGVMQWIVRGMAWAITRVMRVSGAETTSVCASVFIGQTEAPLTIKPYISRMTQSELLTIMIGGMAHIAGGVLAAYVTMLGGSDEAAQVFYAKHLLAASIMAAPATLVIAKILVPETAEPLTRGTVNMEVEKSTVNVIDAAAVGASDGLRLALNVGAMLLAFIALIALINWPLTWLGEVTGLAAALGKPTDLATILGYVLAPIAWVIGTPWADATAVGGLIGEKIVLNEFVAYAHLSEILKGGTDIVLSPEATLIADRHLRPVRVRQLLVDRDPDRRHRRAGARPSLRPGAVRAARGARRLDRHLHDRDNRRRADLVLDVT